MFDLSDWYCPSCGYLWSGGVSVCPRCDEFGEEQ